MDLVQIEIIFQLFLAAILGGLVGLERGYRGRSAGLRTYALVAMGSALFSVIALHGFTDFAFDVGVQFDPSRIISNIVVGIGFLGGGIILLKHGGIPQGLTTAAGLWVAAAIGVAVGVRMYVIAAVATVFTLIIFYALLEVEYRLYKKREGENEE